jgi:hypothetical protein
MINAVEAQKIEWKKNVQTTITRALREAVEDDDRIPLDMLKTTLRRMMNNMELPELDLSSHAFNSGHTGALEGYEAEAFMDEANNYIAGLRTLYSKKTGEFISAIEKSAKKEKVSNLIFKDLQEQIDTLEKEIGNKKLTLDRLDKCKKALVAI